jgi:hypothetical protein
LLGTVEDLEHTARESGNCHAPCGTRHEKSAEIEAANHPAETALKIAESRKMGGSLLAKGFYFPAVLYDPARCALPLE